MRNIKLSFPRFHPLSLDLERNLISNSKPRNHTTPIDLAAFWKKIFKERNIPFSAKRWMSTNRLSVLVYQELLDYYGDDLRILNVVRDGRDVVVENDEKIMGRYAVSPERWVYDVIEGMKFEDHPQVFTIRYEDLVQNRAQTIRRITEFIGEEDRVPFSFNRKKAKIVEPRYWIGRWQQPQFSERIDEFLQTPGARECMQHYGYIK